jgi:nicotinate-nucleotide adenylyltransferase
MRIGILGGTFDPVHYGHLLMAEISRQSLQLDEVRFLPAGVPPHKQGRAITAGELRAEMLELAVSGYPEFRIDRREIRRDGPSFTVLTLTEYKAEYPEAELYFVMGSDSLSELLTWREPERIAELATIVACNRPGVPEPTSDQVAKWVTPALAARVRIVAIPGTDLSSTEMRDRVRLQQGVRFMTPRAVEAYIVQQRLYMNSVEQ